MNFNLRDPKTLSSVQPDAISAYLQARGWQIVAEWEDKAITWELDMPSDQYNLFVPITTGYADYALRIGDILNTLAEVEQRSKSEIYNDLLTTELEEDVLRIRAFHPDAADGSIPLRDWVKLSEGTFRMLESAASVVEHKRPYLPSNKPLEVKQFLSATRIGQSEIGSYVVVVHSPVAGASTEDLSNRSDPPENETFGRQVMTTLAEALTTLKSISSDLNVNQAGENEVEKHVDSFVQSGGTAELCEALEKLNESVREQQVELDFTWSKTLPLLENVPSVIALDKSISSITERFRLTLRRRQQKEIVAVKGKIVNFKDGDFQGDAYVIAVVTLKANVNKKPRNIRIPLFSEEDRQLVIKALGERRQLSATGRFVEFTNYNVLRDYSDLQIVED